MLINVKFSGSVRFNPKLKSFHFKQNSPGPARAGNRPVPPDQPDRRYDVTVWRSNGADGGDDEEGAEGFHRKHPSLGGGEQHISQRPLRGVERRRENLIIDFDFKYKTF